MIIGISGKIGSGKDVIGQIIKWYDTFYTYKHLYTEDKIDSLVLQRIKLYLEDNRRVCEMSKFKTVKYADKLKDIVCIILNCTRQDLENPEFKNKILGKEWKKYKVEYNFIEDPITYTKERYFDNLSEANIFAKQYNSWPELIDLTPRLLLQLLGTECGRQIIHPNIWINSTFAYYNKSGIHYYHYDEENEEHVVYDKPDMSGNLLRAPKTYSRNEAIEKFYKITESNWIITDVRFENEMQAVLDRKGLMIRVERYCYDSLEDFCVGHPKEEVRKEAIRLLETISNNYELLPKLQYLAESNGYIDLKEQHESETALDKFVSPSYLILEAGKYAYGKSKNSIRTSEEWKSLYDEKFNELSENLFENVVYNKDIEQLIKSIKQILIKNKII